ncbi:MAG: hypothetical protein AAB112_06820, partial [Thermodesulfobacteriota bacterium]
IPPRAGHFSTRKISNARFRDPISKLRKFLAAAIPAVRGNRGMEPPCKPFRAPAFEGVTVVRVFTRSSIMPVSPPEHTE